ncbi:hypothetical protein M427DRAFT_131892 [Gonapodya prolifera JEL478]|uniref:Uncharacterized protein n=1 Tax=Gonapodya prolifera (strain JEL478) TaxID=1344416 RepID=A0A139ATB8_GONPJ|nr:hypothetical protein M427DRAFT_131892 [Gonapodya prolifera JEL478]|eukprot:KXS19968.1 hypothetical protein M427DRAFT_131892 [Gonapodya prolifera JEL478]
MPKPSDFLARRRLHRLRRAQPQLSYCHQPLALAMGSLLLFGWSTAVPQILVFDPVLDRNEVRLRHLGGRGLSAGAGIRGHPLRDMVADGFAADLEGGVLGEREHLRRVSW